MNEQDLTRRLGLLTDDPVAPPDELRLGLWLAIESELIEHRGPGIEGQVPGEEELIPVGPDPLPGRWRLVGPVRAAAVFLVVIALGALAFWLRPRELPDQMVDTTGPSPSVTETAGTVPTGHVEIDGAGTISLQEGYFPQAIADAGGGLVVVVADPSPYIADTPPQEQGTVLAIDRGSGEIRWQRDLDGGPSIVETSADSVWVAHFLTGGVTKLDLQTGDILATAMLELPFDIGNGPDRRQFIPNDVEVAFGSLWVSTARGAVAEIDLESGGLVRVTAVSSDGIPDYIGEMEASDRQMWLAAETAGVVVLDPEDHSIQRITLPALDHTGSSLAFHKGTMFVGGDRLARRDDGSFVISEGGYVASDVSQVTGLDQAALDRYGVAEIPGSTAFLMEVGDRLMAWGGADLLWPIDAEHVTVGPPVRLPLPGSVIVDTGETLWLIDPATQRLHPFTIDDLVAETVTTTPDVEAPSVAWRHVGIGMSSSTLATSGRLVLADEDRVYVADGFGGPQGGQTVAALSAATGEIVWSRDDLVGEGGSVFLQAVIDDTLIVNQQKELVVALDVATGEVRWTFRLPALYGAVGSALVDEGIILTADAQMEGDTRPPLVYALDLADGAQRWQVTLTEGTDLQWHSPATTNGVVVVSSTPSHPESAPGNMVHAVEVDTGEIRWAVDLGGEQGFHQSPTLIQAETVFLRGPAGIVALDLSGGTEKWRSAGTWPLTVVPRGGLLAATESPYGDVAADILLIDPETGAAIVFYEADPTVGIPEGAAFVRDGTVIVTTRFGLRGFDFGGTFLWSWNSLSPVVDLAAFANGFAAMPTADRSVVALTLP